MAFSQESLIEILHAANYSVENANYYVVREESIHIGECFSEDDIDNDYVQESISYYNAPQNADAICVDEELHLVWEVEEELVGEELNEAMGNRFLRALWYGFRNLYAGNGYQAVSMDYDVHQRFNPSEFYAQYCNGQYSNIIEYYELQFRMV